MNRIEEYTIGALARLSGVSVRTLHHYDAVGLLSPARVADNGYRLYTRDEALRLQEILFYRAASMPLAEIAALLDGDDRRTRLEAHRTRLRAALADHARMLAALDHALAELKGKPAMPTRDLYEPFEPTVQADHVDWLVETYGADMAEKITASKAHLATASEGTAQAMERLRGIETALVVSYEAGLPPEAADLAAHRA